MVLGLWLLIDLWTPIFRGGRRLPRIWENFAENRTNPIKELPCWPSKASREHLNRPEIWRGAASYPLNTVIVISRLSVAMLMFWATARTIKRRFPPKYTNDREHQSKLFYCCYYWYNFTKLVWRCDSMLAVLSLCLLIALCSSNRRKGWRLRKNIQKYRVFTPEWLCCSLP